MTNTRLGTAMMMLSMFLLWGLMGGIENLPPDSDSQLITLMVLSVVAAMVGLVGMSLCAVESPYKQ